MSPRSRPTTLLALTAGAAFAAFPLLRPWGDKLPGSDPAGAASMASAFASEAWVTAHTTGMLGWVLLATAAASAAAGASAAARVSAAATASAAPNASDTTRPGARACVAPGSCAITRCAAWLIGLGAAAILPYYGAETFALHAIGEQALSSGELRKLEVQEEIRQGPVQSVLFAGGLLTAAAGGVLLAVGTWRTAAIRWAAVPLALTIATYLPQFFTPAPVRIAHGALLALSCGLWAFSGSRTPGQGRRRPH